MVGRSDAVARALTELAADGGFVATVRGGSMGARLPEGTRVVVRGRRRLLPGDVVVFRNGPALVVHRLLGLSRGRRGWRLLTKGDAMRSPDGWVDARRLVGVAEVPCSAADRLAAAAGFARAALRGAARRLRR